AGAVAIEAQVLDPEQKPLAADRQVRADVRDVRSASAVPQIIDLHPAANKPGWYVGQAPLKKAGDYAVRIAAGADDAFTHRLTIRELESELDDVRVDFGHLQQLASNAGPVLKTLKADARKDVEAALKRSAELESARLFFRLEEAHALVNCLEKAPAKKGAKAEAPKPIQPMQSAFKDKKTLKVLLIDGAGAAGLKNLGDTHCIKSAIQCIPDNLYESVLAHDLPGCRDQPAQALERDDLAQFGAILLLNVPRLQPKQVANLERFSRAGGGVAFFLGPRVDAPRYNATLYRDGKGIFPVPLAPAYHPAAAQKPREETPGNVDQLLLRDDLFPELDRYPILGAVFSERQSRDVLKHLTIGRYFQVPRRTWKKTPGRSFELATLPNDAPANTQAARVAALTQGPLRALSADPTKKTYRPLLERHRDAIENTVRAGSEKRCIDLANAIENCLLDRQLAEFWKSPEPKVRALFIDLAKLRHEARHGDPLIVGGAFGRGRVVAVMTSAGTQWNDFAAGSVASLAYAPFIWETLNYVTHQDGPAFVSGRSSPKGALPPLFLGVDLGFAATTAFNGKDELKALGPIYLVSADASLPFVGTLYSAAGLSDARWEVDVRPMPIAAKKALKNPPMPFTLTVPMEMFQDRRRRRALDELTLQSLGAVMPPRLPDGFSPAHSLSEEVRFDFRKHLGRLKGKNDEPQPEYLVKLSIVATSAGAKAERASRSFYFLIVSNNELAMQAHAGNDDEADRLHRAREKVERSQVLLDEQIARLQSPNTDADTVGVRVAQIRREMDNAAAHAAEASGRLDRLHAEFQINRIDLGNLTAGTSGSADLRKVIHDDDVGFRKAERDLHHVSEALDKNQRENALTGARAARKNLADLRDALAKAAIRMDEGVVELKLIKLLTEIERRQRGVSAELDQRWVEFRRLAIEELLKGSPKDKK
ncbi:MAG: hypothetical protein HYR84_10110, partial [Planctomycetes bacterium]|nr:hypothetical protein [Planctomycetota bacterium]